MEDLYRRKFEAVRRQLEQKEPERAKKMDRIIEEVYGLMLSGREDELLKALHKIEFAKMEPQSMESLSPN